MYTCMRVEAKVGTKQSTEEDSYIRSKHIAYALLGLCAYPCVCVCTFQRSSIRIIARKKSVGRVGEGCVAVRIGSEQAEKGGTFV